jgi:hypothetical protein
MRASVEVVEEVGVEGRVRLEERVVHVAGWVLGRDVVGAVGKVEGVGRVVQVRGWEVVGRVKVEGEVGMVREGEEGQGGKEPAREHEHPPLSLLEEHMLTSA